MHLIIYYARGRWGGEGGADGVFLVTLEEFGEARNVGLGDDAGILHHTDDSGNKVAVEGGALLLAWVINLGGNFWKDKDVSPELVVGGDK